MRTALLSAVLATLAAGQFQVCAQQSTTNALAAATNSTPLRETSKASLPDPASLGLTLSGPGDTNVLNYTLSRTKVRISGPLVRPLKANSPSDFSRRVLHLFSPFSDETPNLPPDAAVTGPVKTRAWSTIVGWSPGSSAFPDDWSHPAPGLRLFSISLGKQPKQP